MKPSATGQWVDLPPMSGPLKEPFEIKVYEIDDVERLQRRRPELITEVNLLCQKTITIFGGFVHYFILKLLFLFLIQQPVQNADKVCWFLIYSNTVNFVVHLYQYHVYQLFCRANLIFLSNVFNIVIIIILWFLMSNTDISLFVGTCILKHKVEGGRAATAADQRPPSQTWDFKRRFRGHESQTDDGP